MAILLRVCALAFVQVEKQIEQMVKFIKQEAEEKSNEIKVSAEEVSRTHTRTWSACVPRKGCGAGTLSGPCLHWASTAHASRNCHLAGQSFCCHALVHALRSALPSASLIQCVRVCCLPAQEFNLEKLQLLEQVGMLGG